MMNHFCNLKYIITIYDYLHISDEEAVPFLGYYHHFKTIFGTNEGRTSYSTPQVVELEKEFRTNRYLNKQRRNELATLLALTDRQIKICNDDNCISNGGNSGRGSGGDSSGGSGNRIENDEENNECASSGNVMKKRKKGNEVNGNEKVALVGTIINEVANRTSSYTSL
uniref:Homeobox domain-containing protein n=1 Tax=Elaeophora elaphi TaxID=1147741 RepID=A0A0R3RMX4_9BILA